MASGTPRNILFILALAASSAFAAESDERQRIPDANRYGATSVITLEDVGYVSEVTVTVDITHSSPADLVVTLRAPSGTEATLHDRIRTRGGVHGRWTLEDFGGERGRGDWSLQVTDLARGSAGTLDRWSVQPTTAPPPAWTCPDAWYGGGLDDFTGIYDSCDCGCGAWDPDCDDPVGSQTLFCDGGDWNGTNSQVCDPELLVCVPTAWTCDPAARYDDVCDCNCGELDSACATAACDPADPFCIDGACAAQHWTGDAAKFADGETCHCSEGDADPDCDDIDLDIQGCADFRATCHPDTGVCVTPKMRALYVHGRTAGTPTDGGYWNLDAPVEGFLSLLDENHFVNWNGRGRINTEAPKVAARFDALCTDNNYCFVYCHSAGCMQTERLLALEGGNHAWNIVKVFQVASAAGGSQLAEFSVDTNLEDVCADYGNSAPPEYPEFEQWAEDLSFNSLPPSFPLDCDLSRVVARSMYDHNQTRGIQIETAAGYDSINIATAAIISGEDDGAVGYDSACACNEVGSFDACDECQPFANHRALSSIGWDLEHGEMKRGYVHSGPHRRFEVQFRTWEGTLDDPELLEFNPANGALSYPLNASFPDILSGCGFLTSEWSHTSLAK